MKKVGVALGILFGVLLVAIVTVPFFVDVDKWRPEIQNAANQQINGSLELGKLKLSLWGGVYLNAEFIRVTIAGESKPVVEAKEFHIEVPFLRLLTGSPTANLVLTKPEVTVVKEMDGNLNLMRLMKTDTLKSASAAPTRSPATESSKKQEKAPATETTVALPSFLADAAIGVEIRDGQIHYTDAKTKEKVDVNGVALELVDVSLQRTIKMILSVPLDVKMKAAKVAGRLEAKANITPILAGGAIRSAKGSININASDLAIDAGAFKKGSGIPITLEASFNGSENDFQLTNLQAAFHTIRLEGKGQFIHKPKMQYKFSFKTPNTFNLDSMADLVAMLSEYKLQGKTSVSAEIEGDSTTPKIKGYAKVSDGSVSYDALLKQPIGFEANVGFRENLLQLDATKLSAKEFDVSITRGQVIDFAKPRIRLYLDSKVMNLDELIDQEKLNASKKTASRSGTSQPVVQLVQEAVQGALAIIPNAVAAEKAKKPVLVNPLYAMNSNPMIASMTGDFRVNIKKFLYSKAPIENIAVKADIADKKLNVSSASLETFGGKVAAKATANFLSKRLEFFSTGSVNGINAQEATKIYVPSYQNILEGKLDADWNIQGAAYPDSQLAKSLTGSIDLKAKEGRLRTIDFKETIGNAMSKVPFLKGKSAPEIDERFRLFRSDIKLKSGVVRVDPIEFRGAGKKSIDFNGNATIQESLDHESFLDVIDPNGVLPKEISQGSGKPSLRLHLQGPLTKPKPDYGYTAKYLAKAALNNNKDKLLKKGLNKVLGGDSKGGEGKKPVDQIKDKIKNKFKLPF